MACPVLTYSPSLRTSRTNVAYRTAMYRIVLRGCTAPRVWCCTLCGTDQADGATRCAVLTLAEGARSKTLASTSLG
eukprot:3589911-Rhodomonas_salina.2